MIQKSIPGKTNKYAGVVKSIKNANPTPEEPRITRDQVIEAFQSFGFPINDRNHNDIAYWTTKPQSEGTKMIEELHKRRTEINKKEDEDKKSEDSKKKADEDFKFKQEQAKKELEHQQNVGKTSMPRLSDEDLAALFDEYGLPAPDPEWARTHLPNDPKKIRSILEMQRKTADDMLKKQAKNTVNSVPEIPKNVPGMGMGGYYGRGGPAPAPAPGGDPMAMQGGMVGDEEPKTPFFIGDHSIVRITNPTNPNLSTIWLVDSKKKVLRPFMSDQAFENAFEDPEEARKAIVTISTKELGKGGSLEGFTPLQGSQGVDDEGGMSEIDFSPATLQNHYGKPEDIQGEQKTLSVLDGILGKLGGQKPQGPQQPQGQLPPQ